MNRKLHDVDFELWLRFRDTTRSDINLSINNTHPLGYKLDSALRGTNPVLDYFITDDAFLFGATVRNSIRQSIFEFNHGNE